MAKAAIIHGTKGTPRSNWFHWLASELRHGQFDVRVPTLPTPEGQSLSSWFAAFDAQVGALDRESLLIGHSLGAVFVLRLLERLDSPIHGVALVAGLTERIGIAEYDDLNSSFVARPFDWPTINRNAPVRICVAADNDPYVPFRQNEELAAGLKTELIVIRGGGHLNSESGYTEFPRLLGALAETGLVKKFD